MGFVPAGAMWYLAEMVEEITVEGDPRNVVHVNFVLVRADSPDEAYQRALALGKQAEQRYANPAGRMVTCVFHGLRDLNVIHDDLEHGAELMYQQRIGVSAEQLQQWVKPREKLRVFLPWKPPSPDSQPDYRAKEIVDEAKKLLRGK